MAQSSNPSVMPVSQSPKWRGSSSWEPTRQLIATSRRGLEANGRMRPPSLLVDSGRPARSQPSATGAYDSRTLRRVLRQSTGCPLARLILLSVPGRRGSLARHLVFAGPAGRIVRLIGGDATSTFTTGVVAAVSAVVSGIRHRIRPSLLTSRHASRSSARSARSSALTNSAAVA